MKNIRIFVSENFQVFGGESFYILNRRTFVMVYFPVFFFFFFFSEFSICQLYSCKERHFWNAKKKKKKKKTLLFTIHLKIYMQQK